MRQNAVARSHHGHAHTHLREGGNELGTGHAGADDDEVLRLLLEVINLLPGQDALAVRLRARQDARGGTGGNEDQVRVEGLGGAISVGDINLVRGTLHAVLVLGECGAAIDDLDADLLQARAHVAGLVAGQRLHAAVKRLQAQLQRAELVVQAHIIRAAEIGADVGAGNKGLRRDAVQENGGATGALFLNQRNVRAVLGAGSRSLIACGAAADNYDAGGFL